MHEELDDLLEAQVEVSKNNNSYAEKQLSKIKKKLVEKGKLAEQDLINICEIQNELAKLEIEVGNKLEAKIEIPNK